MAMNQALEIFTRQPKTHNCAQSVAAGCGREDLVDSLKPMGGGRAPEGRCGALQAVLAATPESCHAVLCRRFSEAVGSESCRELKKNGVPCEKCVEAGASLLEEARQH